MDKKVVIIPTYNEKDNIEKMIRCIFMLDKGFHILIIDDNSPDGTADTVETLQKNHIGQLYLIKRGEKLGLGTAYITGFEWALNNNYDYICEMDADFSHNPKDLEHLYKACKNGADLAIGSRYVSGVNVVNWPLGRVLMSYCASIYVRIITGMKIHDATAGFKCYKRHVLETIEFNKIRSRGYAFQIEMKFITWRLGFSIVEIPIVFTDRKYGSSKMSGGIFNEALWGVIGMKLRSLFKKPKKVNKNETPSHL